MTMIGQEPTRGELQKVVAVFRMVWRKKATPQPEGQVHIAVDGRWTPGSMIWTTRGNFAFCGRMIPRGVAKLGHDHFEWKTTLTFIDDIDCQDCAAAWAAWRISSAPGT